MKETLESKYPNTFPKHFPQGEHGKVTCEGYMQKQSSCDMTRVKGEKCRKPKFDKR